MYRTFARRIRDAWEDEVRDMLRCGSSPRGWVVNGGAVVAPLIWRLPAIGATGRDWASLPFNAAQRVVQFISCYTVPAAKMMKPRGVNFISRVRRECDPSFSNDNLQHPWRPGSFIAVRDPFGKKRCIAVVVRPIWEPKDAAIAKSMETDRAFSDHIWVVARHFHRERRRGVTTAAAEGWTGVLGRLWDPVQGQSSGSMVDRLLLSAHGFKGIGEDEHLVDIVEKAVAKTPFATRGRRRGKGDPATVQSRRLGRGCGNKSWLQTDRAKAMSPTVVLARQSMTEWRRTADIARRTFDRADLSERDVQRLILHRKRKAALEEFPMTRVQRARYGKLSQAARHAFRAKLRVLQAEVRTKGKGKGPCNSKRGKIGKGRGKGKAKGKASGLAKIAGAVRAKSGTAPVKRNLPVVIDLL